MTFERFILIQSVLFLLPGMAAPLFAQQRWTKTYGGRNEEAGSYVQQTQDGGYLVVGYTNSYGAGNYDVYLIKTNASGDTLWTRTYGGIYDDDGRSVWQTRDSGLIIAGSSRSFSGGTSTILSGPFPFMASTGSGEPWRSAFLPRKNMSRTAWDM